MSVDEITVLSVEHSIRLREMANGMRFGSEKLKQTIAQQERLLDNMCPVMKGQTEASKAKQIARKKSRKEKIAGNLKALHNDLVRWGLTIDRILPTGYDGGSSFGALQGGRREEKS